MKVEQLLQSMTLDEKIGQLFLLAFSGERVDEARIMMEEHRIGGAYISNDNIPTPEKAYDLTTTLQSYAGNTRLKIPLLLGADQEGAWSVMTPGSCPGPGNMALGATADPQCAYDMYRVMGEELLAVGINALLAPCADSNSNPTNSIIGMRSFGEPPELVGAMAAAAVQGARDSGIAATVKHFPGHGDTRLDSHRGLPTVNRSAEELQRIDLYPFQKGIDAGVDIVMTAHIVFPALDPDHPATMSSIILNDVLRQQMGFTGLILSDSMNMGAMKRHFDPAQSVVMALRAGVDMIMLAEEHYDHDSAMYIDRQCALLAAVKNAVEAGELPLQRVDDAVRHILELKSRRGLFDQPKPEKRQALALVGSELHQAVELNVAQQAVAVLHDANGLVPLVEDEPLVVVNTTTRRSYDVLGHTRGIGPNQTVAAFDYFIHALKNKRKQITVLSAEQVLENGIGAELGAGTLVAVTENYPLPGMDFDQTSQRQIVRLLAEYAPDRLLIVALRDPYELSSFPEVKNYVCAFSFRPCAAQAAVDVLCGDFAARGRTPVSVPGTDIKADWVPPDKA